MTDVMCAQVVRNGFVECLHRGRAVIVNADGSIREAWGDAEALIYPRSANKPMQLLAMLRSGLQLPQRQLALAGASHSGEPFHIDEVLSMLAGGGLTATDLGNTASLPLDDAARNAWLAAGRTEEAIAMNCSGKHAAMLRTCQAAGWPLEGYLDPEHPLQREVARAMLDTTGAAEHVAVDGCGAPLFATSLAGLAKAFGRFAGAEGGELWVVADAYREYPEYVSGTTRDECKLHRAVPGLLVKTGAEGCLAVGLPDGTGLAVKISDGSARAAMPVMTSLLRRIGIHVPADIGEVLVLGHGKPVGEVRSTI